MSDAAVATPDEPTLMGHPKGLFVLFFAEMWERFSYYGMRALLTLYMTKVFLFSDDKAYVIYGAYTSLVYATPFIGGILADRYLGKKKAVTCGGILMALGHFLMAFEPMWAFYGALGLLIAGNGLFKPNISTIVGELYKENDPRRDGGFTIFYMGINLGAWLAPLVCGWIGETVGWHYGFGLAGVGMVLGQIVFSAGGGILKDHGNPPDREKLKSKVGGILSLEWFLYALIMIAVVVFSLLVFNEANNPIVGYLLNTAGVLILGYLFYIAVTSPKVERERLFVIMVLVFFSTMFWAFFEQAGSSINLFTDRNVDRHLTSSFEVPASVFQAINPAYILLLGIPFTMLWTWLGRIGKEPSTPVKFSLGILQLGLGFLALWYGCTLHDNGMVGVLWLFLGYLLHTTGELCLSPVGLSMVTKLAPAKIVSMVMGTWFLSNAFANYLAAVLARLTAGGGEEGAAAVGAAPVDTVMVYGDFFQKIGFVAVGVAVFLMVLVPLLRRWMHGVH